MPTERITWYDMTTKVTLKSFAVTLEHDRRSHRLPFLIPMKYTQSRLPKLAMMQYSARLAMAEPTRHKKKLIPPVLVTGGTA